MLVVMAMMVMVVVAQLSCLALQAQEFGILRALCTSSYRVMKSWEMVNGRWDFMLKYKGEEHKENTWIVLPLFPATAERMPAASAGNY